MESTGIGGAPPPGRESHRPSARTPQCPIPQPHFSANGRREAHPLHGLYMRYI